MIPVAKPPHLYANGPENIALQGGGPKGIAYLGTIEVLETTGALQSVKRIAGTSAGAITAVYLSLNHSSREMMEIMGATDFASFLDVDGKLDPNVKKVFTGIVQGSLSLGDALFQLVHKSSGAWSFFKGQLPLTKSFAITDLLPSLGLPGICKGDRIREWIEDNIANKVKVKYLTFGELNQLIQDGQPLRHLHVFATTLETPSRTERFSSEDRECDDYIISDAIRASMSIPVAYIPHTMHKKVNGKRVPCEGLPRFIDGGVRYNFPVTAFDQRRFIKSNLDGSDPQKPKFNKRTLGICLYSSTQPKIPQNVGEQCLSIISNIGASDTEWQVNPGLRRRIIEINDQGVGTLEFGLDGEKKGKLIEAGRKAKYAFSQADILRVLDRSNDESVVRQCLDLADSSYVRGDFAGALKLYTRAREIEEPFGPEAQSIGALFFNEALCLANQGSFREAYEFYEKACKILSKLHKDTTQIELGMARCCAHLALYDAANDYYSLALSKLGEQAHSRPDVMKFSLAMADSYLKEKKYVDALGFYDKAYKFMKKIYGDSHPHLVVPMFGMVQCYVEQREYAEALKLCPGLLKVSDAAVKSEHALTAMHCLAFMGDCEWKYKEHGYHSYEHRQNALILYKKALDCGIAVLGKTDPLISILQDIHNHREIRMYMNIASSQTVHHRGFGRG